MKAGLGVVDKYYSAGELVGLVGFTERWWCDHMKADPRLEVDGVLVSQCVLVGNQYLAPASWVNHFLQARAVVYDPGIKARNLAELKRKLQAVTEEDAKALEVIP